MLFESVEENKAEMLNREVMTIDFILKAEHTSQEFGKAILWPLSFDTHSAFNVS